MKKRAISLVVVAALVVGAGSAFSVLIPQIPGQVDSGVAVDYLTGYTDAACAALSLHHESLVGTPCEEGLIPVDTVCTPQILTVKCSWANPNGLCSCNSSVKSACGQCCQSIEKGKVYAFSYQATIPCD
jgi:hypothetical protein